MNPDCSGGFMGCTSKVDNYTATNIGASIIANRVSHVFDLRGPSMVLDSACSASLVAIHMGCQAILTGDCEMAICGGVNIMTMPDMFVHLSKAGMVSPTGLCHTFSKNADGYTRGEGCGIVILRRLLEAERQGYKLWATVSTGTNQDGRQEKLLTNPSGFQQKELLKFVYDKSNIDINSVDYIEAHGTGTPAGDPVEVNALGSLFKEHGSPRDRYIGSVKTNIAHTEAAAGVLGLIKVLLMMKHGKIVPSLHCDVDEVNPQINLDNFKFKIPRTIIPWDNKAKIAACNSFGYGGSNCHAVVKNLGKRICPEKKHTGNAFENGSCPRDSSLTKPTQLGLASTQKHLIIKGKPETYTESSAEKQLSKSVTPGNIMYTSHTHFIVCFSGKTLESLKGSLEDLQADSEALKLDIQDIAYTSTVRRDHYLHRAAFLAEDMQDLHTQIDERLSEMEATSSTSNKSKPKVVFVFSGMVPVWEGMCKELFEQNNTFRAALQLVEIHLQSYVSWSLTERLMTEDPSKDAVLSPISIFACQIGLLEMWRSIGVYPDCVVGQSFGEIPAAYSAGCLSLADAVRIVYHRSRLLATVTGGAMLLIQNVDVENVRQLVKTLQGKAVVALEYSPMSCTISADTDILPTLKQQLKARGMSYRQLNLPVAYHSHHVEPCLKDLKTSINGIKSLPPIPTVIYISTVTGCQVEQAPDDSHWMQNARDPVLFGQAMKAVAKAVKQENPVFVEIGPKSVLQAHMKDLFPQNKSGAIQSMDKSKELKAFLNAVRSLYERQAEIKFRPLYNDGNLTDAPRYIFDRKNNRERTEMDVFLQDGVDTYRKNHLYVLPIHGCCDEFRLLISPMSVASVYDHVLSGKIIIPGAFYVEAALAVAQYIGISNQKHRASVSAQFINLLTVKKDEVMTCSVSVSNADSSQTSLLVQKNGKHLAKLTLEREEPHSPVVVNVQHLQSKCKTKMSKEGIYGALRQSGFNYGETFQLLQGGGKNASECIAEIKLHERVQREMGTTCIHPSILDCMLQSTFIVMDGRSELGMGTLPTGMERLIVHSPMETSMMVYTRLKKQTVDGFVLDQQLLSSAGHVIAELMGLKIQLLNPQKATIPKMISAEWQKVKEFRLANTTEVVSECSTPIVFTNKDLHPERLKCQTISYQNRLHLPNFQEEITTAFSSDHDISRVCLLYFEHITDEMHGTAIQDQLISLSCLIQTIVKNLMEKDAKIPFYLCTLNAWPTPTDTGIEQEVNPTATALWGLLRTMVAENVLRHVTAVELHIAFRELTSDSLQLSLVALEADEESQGCPEILLTSSAKYLNCIEEKKEMTVPHHRQKDGTHEDSIPTKAVILSRETAAACDLIAITADLDQKSCRGSQQNLKLHTLIQPASELLTLSVSPDSIGVHGNPSTHNKVLMALEVAGHIHDKPEEQVISCSPTPVCLETSVPVETTVLASQIPDYQPGDLSRLVLLKQLCESILTDRATILTSESTKHLASCLSLMCPDKSVNTVMIESLNEGNLHLSETLLTLVLLDKNVMADVQTFWKVPKRLISCSSLVTAEARSFLSCMIPNVELCLHDTQLVFQPCELSRVLPKIKAWMKSNQQGMSHITRALHSATQGSSANDLSQLFMFKHHKMSDLSVRFLSEKLFRRDSCYIVVGGLTGLGWMCVKFLAENNAGYIAIVNRSAPSAEKREDMANVSAANRCKIQAFQTDISSFDSLRCTLHTIQQTSGLQLRGVFTGAATIDDSVFKTLGRKQFEKVMTPKVLGTWNLHKLTEDMPLDYFVTHSSVAAVLGNLGQANYSAANAFQDGLVHYRRQHGLVGQTINWGPLDTGLLNNQDAIKKRLIAMGFSLATEQNIMQTLKVVLLLNLTQCAPVDIDYTVYCQKMSRSEVPALIYRMKKLTSTSDQAQGHSTSFKEMDGGSLKTMEAGPDRLLACEQYVMELTRRVLGEDHDKITRDADLLELGVDSVTGMMMMNVIARDTSFKIAAVDVFVDATIGSLARALDKCAQEAKEAKQT
ncbi:mycocerosic acid synthase-like [Littorina saxatilis]|uniref:mycocerosic acid synthase-like n=1 Tax=Littorina saxatilis TaxID=31220 RepID=UPI0038B54CFF